MIVQLCELRAVIVREAAEEYRLADTREAAVLLAAARTFVGEIDLYVERLTLQGAQIGKTPPPRGES